MKIAPLQPEPQASGGDYMYSDLPPVYLASTSITPESSKGANGETPNISNGEIPNITNGETPKVTNGDDVGEASEDINAAFTNLSFEKITFDHKNVRSGISEDACLAHLKLLHAIQAMKDDIGYTDGLWNLWNSRGKWALDDYRVDADWPMIRALEKTNSATVLLAGQARIREKRWALFVARAVERYEDWWYSLAETDMLTEKDMTTPDNPKYRTFTNRGGLRWKENMLPPLDVLMVLHTHMLNPRAFLEDSIRHGMGSFWSAGMPWELIHKAIDTDFNYNVSHQAKINWVAKTGHRWRNQDDDMEKILKCPFCPSKNEIPWTTCGMKEDVKDIEFTGLIGHGYGDGNFNHRCPNCQNENYKELLSVTKFVSDASALLVQNVPMPGTILDPGSGRPEVVPEGTKGERYYRTFPNRMIKRELRSKIAELIKPPSQTPIIKKSKSKAKKDKIKKKDKNKEEEEENKTPERLNIKAVRDMIQRILVSPKKIRNIDSETGLFARYQIHTWAGICIRKMMSRYWQNFSPFGLDLCAAVMRQGVFVEKMVKIDWLHSPTARDTMTRLIVKYDRFLQIMKKHPGKVVVPTLDIDLAWHTHQLIPSHYYYYTVSTTGKFIDHDDKIDEDKLSRCFEWTTKTYQDMFDAVYSECTCWYCETIRSSQISAVGRLFGISSNARLSESFHKSETAEKCPPEKSAHISYHNSVKTIETADRRRVTARARTRQRQWLDQEYQKAAKRAEKKGQKFPAKEDYFTLWGAQYTMYGPYPFPPWFAPGMYYGWDPSTIHNGQGAWANCAAAACGNGGIAAGACGGAGGCNNGNGGICGSSGAGVTAGGAGGAGGGGCGGGAGCGGS
ncbi:hypothetical protein TsFJ059_003776 [Trichoderma semiorbis]|uniref:Alpha-ketoglutarate-dependent sulfonate dioxygenase n=1 Tax=Trichoderma semiorbis TaxID=1491008 RepID=A0A9P8KUF5_9HYPO|nr:hypothetical protein TsFJ059_003776 [Trichoderma semiorbis]KAH0528967.1 hypothetical protein TsFJ059_003776 [Trichoderma semiorbis]KAH0528968.1 hypothetical protein TsFJ059_003776 [Trichoderma semiorbis]